MHCYTSHINALNKIKNVDLNKSFYAADYGLTSGDINAIRSILEPTGNTMEVFIHIPTYWDENYGKIIKVKEWKFRKWVKEDNYIQKTKDHYLTMFKKWIEILETF